MIFVEDNLTTPTAQLRLTAANQSSFPMNVLNSNNVKIYNLSSGKSLPQWLSEKRKKALKKNPGICHFSDFSEFRQRIELIQDFEFPTAAQSLKLSRDGNFLVATGKHYHMLKWLGTYNPRMRVWDLQEVTLKFERHLDCEAVQLEIMSGLWFRIANAQTITLRLRFFGPTALWSSTHNLVAITPQGFRSRGAIYPTTAPSATCTCVALATRCIASIWNKYATDLVPLAVNGGVGSLEGLFNKALWVVVLVGVVC